MAQEKIIKSTCGLCAVGCGIRAQVRGNRIVKIEGDPDHPLNKGKLCQKGLASLEYLYHPDRLTVPLKQKGARGSGQWEKISWDEALETIALWLTEIKNQSGPESVAFIHGAAKGLQDSYIARFSYAFGSPNVGWQGHVCFVPRVLASQLTYGFYAIPDYDYPPSCIIIWGKNLSSTLHHAYSRMKKAVQKGSKLIVIDPRPVYEAQKPDVSMQIRPGTDLALALGMIHVIINEKLFDRQFIEKWTWGFSLLKDSVMSFTPEKVAVITWIPAEKIRESARIYAGNRPAVIQWGNAIDHGINNFQTARAICILRAMKKIRFSAVADMFMTPTAALADIVLPAASYLEYDGIVTSPYSYPLVSIQQKIIRTGTCRSDYEILRGLAHKIGLEECFWSTEEACLDFCLKPKGLSFGEFRKIGLLQGQKGFRRHEKEGFSTPTGKIELFSKRLKDWGFDSLSHYTEPPDTPYSEPETAKLFPLVLTTWKHDPYRHSGGRQIQSLRKRQPDPLVWINSRTAAAYGIKNDDGVYIETKRGQILQKARLTDDIDCRVIGVDYGWWFPEKGRQHLYGWNRSNINILTACSPPFGREMGTSNLRGIGCRIRKKTGH
ncbi:molybdopterin-dependent oxidoreductase [Desulfobacula sp.]|uniref:molybdopterin-containing oxidoreductase family protein n=1 Tax=Desulfobacula sp. TaxID=2593537 RepID=UPI0026291D8B|nr:molybdopterin-dependent oxidoreductase [Desulfobacula sp.]